MHREYPEREMAPRIMSRGHPKIPSSSRKLPVYILVVLAVLSCSILFSPVIAATTLPLQVTLTANPAYYTPGNPCQILVGVHDGIGPVDSARVQAGVSASTAAITPEYSFTDSSGQRTLMLTTSAATSGPLTVTVSAGSSGKFGQAFISLPMQTSPAPVVIPQANPGPQPVARAPVAVISVDQYACTIPCTVAFSSAGSFDPDGTITSYTWDFGDSTTATGPGASHRYESAGKYMAVLGVTDNAGLPGSASVVITGTMPSADPLQGTGGNAPVAVIRASPFSGTVPLTVTFDGGDSYDPDGNIVSYVWNFGDGKTGSGPLTDHTYDSAGVYRANLILTDDSGLSSASADYSITTRTTAGTGTTVPQPLNTLPATPAPTISILNGTPPDKPGIINSASTLAKSVRTAAGPPVDPPIFAAVVPPAILPLLAIICGIAIAALASSPVPGIVKEKIPERFIRFSNNLMTSEFFGLLSITEIKKRGLVPSELSKKTVLLLSGREWLVVLGAGLGFALAFILQNRLSIDILRFVIFLCMGAFVVILHDIGHRIMARRCSRQAEVQFWGLGLATMLSTAWLFGTAFAKPSRTVVGPGSGTPGDTKTTALIQVAGPMVNLAAALLSLALIPLGGFFALAGSAGVSMNLLSCAYSLLPVTPMEGQSVYNWNKLVWAVACLPVLGLYLWLFMG